MKKYNFFLIFIPIICFSFVKADKSTKINFETVAKGNYCSENIKKGNYVISSKESKLLKYFPEIKNLDFSEYTILVIVDKLRSSGGYGIEIVKIESDKNTIKCFYSLSEPTGMTTMAITQPFHIVKIKKTDSKIVFKIL